MSEDPSVIFYYLNTGGPLDVKVTDSIGDEFKSQWPIHEITSLN